MTELFCLGAQMAPANQKLSKSRVRNRFQICGSATTASYCLGYADLFFGSLAASDDRARAESPGPRHQKRPQWQVAFVWHRRIRAEMEVCRLGLEWQALYNPQGS